MNYDLKSFQLVTNKFKFEDINDVADNFISGRCKAVG